MMKTVKLLMLGIAILLSFQMNAQKIISVDELAKIYKNKDVVVVSTRKAADYNKVHMTGAINLYHKSFYKDGDIEGLLKDTEALKAMLAKNGITPDKTIVLYDAKSGKYSSRVFWILDYLGYPDVKVLDGQLEAWKAARKPVTAMVSKGKNGEVNVNPDPSKIATMQQVMEASKTKSAYIIDARKEAEFNGSEGRFEPKGHIPGAINVFYEDVLGSNGKFKSKEQILNLMKSKGIGTDKEVIVYCNTGISASPVYIGLKYIAGYEHVKVYDGAMAEWVSVSDNPVEK